ncbi:MAG: hypothetical protein P8R54_03255 [Myxococcota bacterium]|nr:hypothetical protein [Myxococcota bacterium]
MGQRRALIRVVLAAVALGLGWSLGGPPAPLPVIAPERTGMLSTETHSALRSAGRSERSSWGEQLMVEEAALRRQLDALMGEPEPWPEDIPPELQPDRFQAGLLEDFTAAIGASPRRVDCEGFPCLATFAVPMPDSDEDAFLEAVQIRNDLYSQWGQARVEWSSEWGLHVDADGNRWFLMSIGLLPKAASEPLRQQVTTRARLDQISLRDEHSLTPAEL